MPFVGSFEDQYRFKTEEDPPEPASVIGGVPDDLSRICADLISRDHDRRRAGRDGLFQLGSSRSVRSRSSRTLIDGERMFVGREAALASLTRAFSQVQSGTAVSVLIHGPSGIGKSALVRRFLEQLPNVVVLRGRCYEREAVPYQALDGIIDSLGQYLNSRSVEQHQCRVAGRPGSVGADVPGARTGRFVDP